MAETPSAYFAVVPQDVTIDTPNMQYVDLVVQPIAAVTLVTEPKDMEMAEKLAPLAAVVEKDDTVMGFTIKVLVNCVALKKGDLRTKPQVGTSSQNRSEERRPPPKITTQQLLKRMRHR